MSSQFAFVLLLLAVGMCMGTVFDIYNTVTGASKWFRWLRPALDLAFWVISAAVVYYVVFITDDGKVRFYVFGLLAIGYVGYRITLHHRVVGSAFVIIRIVDAVLRALYKTFHTLAIRPLMLVLRIVWAVARAAYRVLCMVESWVFAILEFWMKVLFIRWVMRLPVMQRGLSRFHVVWEEMWALASKWLRDRVERI